MDAQSFVYWLQGFAELHEEPPTAAQWTSIRDHLSLVFDKVTPPMETGEAPVERELVRRLLPLNRLSLRESEKQRVRDIIRCSTTLPASDRERPLRLIC